MENMEDNVFVNIIAYSLVGAVALVIIAVALAFGLWVVAKILKSASKDLPKKNGVNLDNQHGGQWGRGAR